jgi:hypothetical protein
MDKRGLESQAPREEEAAQLAVSPGLLQGFGLSPGRFGAD